MARNSTQKKNKSRKVAKKEKRKIKHQGYRPLDQIKYQGDAGFENIDNLPSEGKFGCKKCDRYFKDEKTLIIHNKTKAHKKRIKEWLVKTHDKKDAEMAAGLY